MGFTTILFYILSLILVISGIKVISSNNPVLAALFLVLAFFSTSIIWMMLEAEFLSMMLVLIYVGAVMVLLLFVVMMIDINIILKQRDFKNFLPMAIFIGIAIIIESALVLWRSYGSITFKARDMTIRSVSVTNTHLIGKVIYTDYVFGFEIAGFVLLTAIIAAIALTVPKQSKWKNQCVSEQVNVRIRDRIRIIKD